MPLCTLALVSAGLVVCKLEPSWSDFDPNPNPSLLLDNLS